MKTWFVLVASWVVLVLTPCRAERDMESDFAWFAKLGFTDVKELAFVRYCYGTASYGNGKKEEIWSEGFLLDETPDKFRVLTLDFETVELSKTDHSFDANRRYEAADLQKYAESELALDESKEKSLFRRLKSGPHFTDRTRLFVLGWICERKGLNEIAAKLYAAAQTARGVPSNERGHEAGWPFRDKLDRDLGHFEMWRAVAAFSDPAVTRPELLAGLQALPKKYPHCDYLSRAAAMAMVLESMIAEDEAHPKRSRDEIAALPRNEQAAEWIFRLRDQNGHQFSQPGSVDIFATLDGSKDTPAHQLVKLGDDAVPALIAALGDTRLTRSVGYGRDFVFSHEVITIGDAALTIIERIASRQFYRSGSIQGTMARDRQTDAVRAAVQSWWNARQSKGALGELADTVARGEFSAARAGAKLLAEFPNDAATPILAGAAAATHEDERCEFVELVGQLKDDRAPEFLLRETREGKFLSSRVEAGWQLAKAGRMDGLPPLIQTWKESVPSSRSASGRSALIGLLASVDSPECIRALADGLRKRSPEARSRVIEAFGAGRELWPLRLRHGQNPKTPLSPESASALEALLVSELDDFGNYRGSTSFQFGAIFPHPRIWDEAATQLANRWPDRYHFDATASYPARERQSIGFLNTWREAHGQPPLPVPPNPEPVDEGKRSKIAEVVIVNGALVWPESMRALALAARGQDVKSDLFQKLEQAYLDACAGHPPAGDLGFSLDVFRENATDGITFIATPVERTGLAEYPKREWRLDYVLNFGESERLADSDIGLFRDDHAAWNRSKVDEIFHKIAELPVDARFHLHAELAPQLWDYDTAL